MSPSLELVGDWTSARLLLRLMAATDSPWVPTDKGLLQRDTGDRCRLTMRGADLGLVARFEEGDSPIAPSMTDEILAAIAAHKSVLRITDPSPPQRALVALTRCGAGLVNAGAIALWCPQSGAVHSADRWLALAEAIEGEEPREFLSAAYVRPLVRSGAHWRSAGMGLLGCPDAAVPGELPDATALDLLSRATDALQHGVGPTEGGSELASARTRGYRWRHTPDADPASKTFNPLGLWALTAP